MDYLYKSLYFLKETDDIETVKNTEIVYILLTEIQVESIKTKEIPFFDFQVFLVTTILFVLLLLQKLVLIVSYFLPN